MQRYITVAKSKIEEMKFIYKPVLVMVCVYLVGSYAILRANFNYIDDMGRVLEGYKSWDYFSRYLSNFLSNFIHADSYLTDISPLPQLLAIVILSLSGILFLYVITGKSKFSIGQYIALIPLGLSPYFLECISYKYDSVYMALSILASIAPLLFRFQKKYFVASVLGILIVCTTYQAASGIFPMLVIFLATRSWMKGENREEILRFVVISAIGYIAGLVLFKGFIMKPVDTYVDISVISTNNIIINTFANYKHYFELVRSDFKAEWIIIIYLMVLFCIVSFLKDTKRNKVATLLGGIICLILMMCTVFGVYPILTEPSFEPRWSYVKI